MSRGGSRNFSKFYFTIVSIASVIGMVIAFGIALYNLIIGAIITDEEYFLGRDHWEVEQCSDPYSYPENNFNRPVPVDIIDGRELEARSGSGVSLTQEQIDECEQKAIKRSSLSRSITKKEAVTGGLIRGTLFSILFLTHFPKMQSSNDIPKPTPRKRKTPTRRKTTKK